MLKVNNLKLGVEVENPLENLKVLVAKKFRVNEAQLSDFKIVKQSLDARRANDIKYVYSVECEIKNEDKYLKIKDVNKVNNYEHIIFRAKSKHRPVVVGAGPAGLFSALILAEAGLEPIVVERGKSVKERKADIDLFWKTGKLNKESNVQFGAGGAGTFSDGKLTTGVKNIYKGKVLDELVLAGAPSEIVYKQKPHIGTDILMTVVENLCAKIESLGGKILFSHKLIGIECKDDVIKKVTVKNDDTQQEFITDDVIVAIGHSARDTVKMLYKSGMKMEAKPFAVGVRIEHKQRLIDKRQYKDDKLAKLVGAAEYKLNAHLENGRGVYTFCMCPGGTVVASSSEEEMVVTNGMSYYARDLDNANSALLVGVKPEDFGSSHPLAGIEFQRELERKAFLVGGSNYHAPVQLVGDFLNDRASTGCGEVAPSYKPDVKYTSITDVFPTFIVESLKKGIVELDKKLKGFADFDAVLTAVESRSSSPITMVRGEYHSSYDSNIEGLYPCGEGAGYAGGIMSASIDGIRVAKKIVEKYAKI